MKSKLDKNGQALMDEFIAQVEEQMELRGVTVAQLAQLTGLSRQYIYRILNGTHIPSLSIAQNIASKLGLSLELIEDK